MIAVDNMPLCTPENRGFKRFIKTAAPHYKPPSRRTLTRNVDAKYETLKQKVKAELADVKFLCLTSDTWTETKTVKTYLGVTVHYFKREKLESIKLGIFPLNQSHTGIYLAQKLNKVCTDWQIKDESVVAVVTDNGANIVNAVSIAFGKKRHLGCFGHTLQLVPSKSMKFTPGLADLISKVKRIVTYFKQSANAVDELRRIQLFQGETEGTLRKLIQDVDTRWNSEFLMSERFVEMAPLISAALFNLRNAPPMLDREEMETLKEMVEILRPIEQATRELSAQSYVTCSVIIPMVNCIKLSL